jgi:cysteate synthase
MALGSERSECGDTRAGKRVASEQRPEFEGLKHYVLNCRCCGWRGEDDGFLLKCEFCQSNGLLCTQYRTKELIISESDGGLFRYRKWLPIRRTTVSKTCTVTYFGEKLAEAVGVKNLWIAFNGYWPERGAFFPTGTFKDLEASCVLARVPSGATRVLVIASAGNTAVAFARAASLENYPCVIIVPEASLGRIKLDIPPAARVKIVSLLPPADYTDAITIADEVSQLPGFISEGGAKNVARRDALGTVMLNVFETIGRLPDYYFQAIGSGTGAIGAHEAARRLASDHGQLPRLWLSQNLPFAPISSAWRSGSRRLAQFDEAQARHQIAQIKATALSNRFPPYSPLGGVYDVLCESRGEVLTVTNDEIQHAAILFEKVEGIDIEPEGAATLASLLHAVSLSHIDRESAIVVNVTGGGRKRLASDRGFEQAKAAISIDVRDRDAVSRIVQLC